MKKIIFLIILFLSIIISQNAFAIKFTIEWDANAESVDGYKVYTNTDPAQPWGEPLDTVNNSTTFTTPDMTNEKHYFVVTAYKGQLESGYSNIVSGGPKETELSIVTGVICSENVQLGGE